MGDRLADELQIRSRLGTRQRQLLSYLAEAERCEWSPESVSEIALCLGVHPRLLGAAMRRLHRAGLVGVASKTDYVARCWRITDAGLVAANGEAQHG